MREGRTSLGGEERKSDETIKIAENSERRKAAETRVRKEGETAKSMSERRRGTMNSDEH